MYVQVSLKIEMTASVGLVQMEQQIQQAGQQAMREALKQAIRQWEEQHPACPHCGAKAHRLEGTTRRVIATLFGRVAVQRRRFRCQGCGRRWCPAKSLFVELQGGTVTAPLQEAALLAGCSWPYRAASAALKRRSFAQISAEEIRLLTNRQGQQRAAQQQAEAERVCSVAVQESAAAGNTEQPLLVGVDGGGGSVAASSGAGWRARWPWCVTRSKICRCQRLAPRSPGASGEQDVHLGNAIGSPGGATWRPLPHRRSWEPSPRQQHGR